jgi:hypothetical protein
VDAASAGETSERKRRSTLDLFNDEMSVLERPLVDDVEYYDEVPPRSGWRKVGAFVAAAAMTAGGALFFMKHYPPKGAVAAQTAQAVSPAAAKVATTPVAPVAPVVAPAPAAAAPAVAATAPAASAKVEVAANEAAPAEAPAGDDGEQAADEAPARQGAVKPSAWVKASHHAGHARHSRADKASARHHKSTTHHR